VGAPVGVDRETWSEGVVHVSTGVGNVSAGFGDGRAAGTIPGGRLSFVRSHDCF
jgi:hypothetical protein